MITAAERHLSSECCSGILFFEGNDLFHKVYLPAFLSLSSLDIFAFPVAIIIRSRS